MTTNVATKPLTARLDDFAEQLAWLVERQRRQEEFIAEMTPILRAVLATAGNRLDNAEKRGWFAFGQEMAHVAERVLDHYTADDVRAFGEAVVSILDTLRALTQPDVLAMLGETAAGVERLEEVEPVGLFGMMRATRQAEVQKGLAVLLELVRHVGRAAEAARAKQAVAGDKKARLAAALGPRHARRVQTLPPERPAPVGTNIDGIAFNADGHLADPSLWTPELAEKIAAALGHELTSEHWKVIEAARADFEANQAAPNIRRLTQVSGMTTRDIYTLFPKAPGRTIARIAGTPKPVGCI